MKWTVRLAAMLLVLTCAVSIMTACGDDSTVVVEPASKDDAAPKSVIVTVPAEGEKYPVVNVSYLLALCGPETPWSELEVYEFTTNEEGAAVFVVDFGEGKERGSLTVTYDEETTFLTKAVLVYGDSINMDLVQGDWKTLQPVLDAIRE